jgi:hypothetical protein
MSNNDTRGFEYNPTDSTDRPQGQRPDDAAGSDAVGEERNQAGTGASLQEYRFSEYNKAQTRGVLAGTVDDVFNALVEVVDPVSTQKTVTGTSLKNDAELQHTPNQIGKALRELSEADDCPVYVSLWGGESTTPQRWEVSIPAEPVGAAPERLHYGSSTGAAKRTLHVDDECQRLQRSDSTTSAPATHPPRGTICTLCAPDLTMDDLGPGAEPQSDSEGDRGLVTDGGSVDPAQGEPIDAIEIDHDAWYVLDADRPAVVGGPYQNRADAIHVAGCSGPEHAVVSGERVAELNDSETTLVWRTDDVPIVTDGGQPVGESDSSSSGAIDNEFEDAERSSLEVLLDAEQKADGRPHGDLKAGDVAIDLVTRQPLYIVSRVANNLPQYYGDEEFDLLTYKQHLYLPVGIDDAVFECVFIGGLDDLHSFSKTYDYPAGRLARVPVEVATEDKQ